MLIKKKKKKNIFLYMFENHTQENDNFFLKIKVKKLHKFWKNALNFDEFKIKWCFQTIPFVHI